jgi:hypothetical protein
MEQKNLVEIPQDVDYALLITLKRFDDEIEVRDFIVKGDDSRLTVAAMALGTYMTKMKFFTGHLNPFLARWAEAMSGIVAFDQLESLLDATFEMIRREQAAKQAVIDDGNYDHDSFYDVMYCNKRKEQE